MQQADYPLMFSIERVIHDAPDPMYTTPTKKNQNNVLEKRKKMTESINRSIQKMEVEDEIITIISTIKIRTKKYYFSEIKERSTNIKKMILADKEFLEAINPSILQDYKRKLDI